MSEPRKPYLHVVKGADAPPDVLPKGGGPPPGRLGHNAGSVIGTAVMHAAMCWVACCMEQRGERVEVAQIAPGLFDATVYLADAESGAVAGDIMLRVKLDLSSGPVLRTQVEPVHP